jgi:hypothetical protein
MTRISRFMCLVAVLGAAGILGLPGLARADFELTIAEGAQSVTVHDNGVGDLDSRTGLITFSGAVGDFNIQVSIGSSNAATGTLPAQLTINNLSIDTTGFTGTKYLSITLQDDGFSVPWQGAPANLQTQLTVNQLPASSNVTYQSFLDGVAGTQVSLNGVGGTTATNSVSIPTNPYTLESITNYTIVGQGVGNMITVQSTGLTAVTMPAPGGLVLALAGIPCVGFGAWLRRRVSS